MTLAEAIAYFVKSRHEEIQETVAKIVSTQEAREKLAAAGYAVSVGQYASWWEYAYINLNVDVQELPNIRKVLGCKLEKHGKNLDNPEERTVWVHMTPIDYKGVTISFRQKLPEETEAHPGKCKIQLVTPEPCEPYYALVCES